ncbi:uncharacterized protein [Venturia canescens]|uniref:uncharacterized protein n=1 Tax=Venturia canescens TaxID=32260 RepID=UPI001C9D2E36|nr:uncharacterized protein LOC122416617 [Venturia canescens]
MRRNRTYAPLVATTLIMALLSGIEGTNNKRAPKCPKQDPSDRTIHLPHESDCTKFYKCFHGTPILFQCPLMDLHGHRLHFNPELEVCDWPEHAGCMNGSQPTTVQSVTTQSTPIQTEKMSAVTSSEAKPPTTTTALPWTNIPHENNCSLYYEVAKGQRRVKECPQGQHFSPTWLTCMGAEEAGCEWTTVAPQTTTVAVQTTVASKPSCGRDCGDINDGWLTPHECSCDKYYQCSDGDLIRRQCSQGLHFNPKTYSCDYPSSAGCEIPSPSPTTTKPTTSAIPSECPPGNSGHVVQIPHPTNCSLFYKCDNGEKQLSQCPDGLYFNPTIQMCDWPDVAGCTAETSGPTESTSAPSAGPTSPMTSTGAPSTATASASTPEVSPSTSVAPTECPAGDPEPPVSWPHPQNCSLYYTCKNGEKVVQSCPSGLEFNPSKGKCDWPDIAGCVPLTTEGPPITPELSTTSGTEASPGTSQEPSRSPGTTESSSTTGRFTEASSTSEATGADVTPERTTVKWEPSSTQAVDSTPASPDPSCPPDMDGHQIPHETNCSLFYECRGGQKILRECTPGLHFNPDLELCVWPANASCESTTVSSESSSTTLDEATSEKPLPSSTVTPSSPIPVTDATVDPGSGGCIGTCPMPDPQDYTVMLTHGDCTKFCKCSNGQPYVYDCPAGLHFSPEKLVCDYPKDAQCSGQGGYGEPEKNEAVLTELFISNMRTMLRGNKKFTYGWIRKHIVRVHQAVIECGFNEAIVSQTFVTDEVCSRHPVIHKRESSALLELIPQIGLTVANSVLSTAIVVGSILVLVAEAGNFVVSECPKNLQWNETVLIPHENDCTKYYTCVGDEKVDGECPFMNENGDRLFFNPKLHLCDWPSEAGCDLTWSLKTLAKTECEHGPIPTECPKVDATNETVHLAHEWDCTKFYKCLEGSKLLMSCPVGQDGNKLYFNPCEQVCDWRFNVDCVYRNEIELLDDQLSESMEDYPTECPKEDPKNETILLPYEGDCTKYYSCNRGRRYPMDCPVYDKEGDKLFFNPEIHECDWPENVNCVQDESLQNYESSERQTNLPTECPASDSDEDVPVLLPHERDCTEFYMCSHGKKVMKQCPVIDDKRHRLYFNFERQICDWPWNVDCKLPEPEIKAALTECETSPVPTECPKVDSPHCTVHLACPWDCTKYYKCNQGEKCLQNCPHGLHFNKYLQVCDWPWKAGCDSNYTSPLPPTTSTTTTDPPHPTPDPGVNGCIGDCPPYEPQNVIAVLPHEDCRKWCSCEQNGKKVWVCPGDLYFNPTLKKCTSPEQSGCTGRKQVVNNDEALMNILGYNQRFHWIDPPDLYVFSAGKIAAMARISSVANSVLSTAIVVGSILVLVAEAGNFVVSECPKNLQWNETVLIPHENDCTKYYTCVGDEKVDGECPFMNENGDRLFFNPKLHLCDWPSQAGCDLTWSLKTLAKTECEHGPIPTECPKVDATNETVHLAHEWDCTKFYKCLEGSKLLMSCPIGQDGNKLYFNPCEQVCNWRFNVDCVYRNEIELLDDQLSESMEDYPTECPKEDPKNETILLPYEGDCTKYYSCNRGRRYPMDCPVYDKEGDKLFFNPEIHECDWPENVNCVQDESLQNYESSERQTNLPTECPASDSDEDVPVLLPHERDCTEFYMCSHGKKVMKQCPVIDDKRHRLYFNFERQICDWPWNVDCKLPEPEIKATPTECETTPVPTECPKVDSPHCTVHLACPWDCTKFYRCNQGEIFLQNCPRGLHFNKYLQVCDWPWKAGCDSNYTTPFSPTTSITTTPQPTRPPTTAITTPRPTEPPTTTTTTPPPTQPPITTITTPPSTRPPTTTTTTPQPTQPPITTITTPPSTQPPTIPTTTPGPTQHPTTTTTTLRPTRLPTTTTTTTQPTQPPITTITTPPSTQPPTIPTTTPGPTQHPTTTTTTLRPTRLPTTTTTTTQPTQSPITTITTPPSTGPLTIPTTAPEPTQPPTTTLTTPQPTRPPTTTPQPTQSPITTITTPPSTGPPTIPTTAPEPTQPPTTTLTTPQPTRPPTTITTTPRPDPPHPTPDPGVNGCIGKCPSYNPQNKIAILPHEDCRKWCSCERYRKKVWLCPGALYFSPTLKQCTSLEKSGCTVKKQKAINDEAPMDILESSPVVIRVFVTERIDRVETHTVGKSATMARISSMNVMLSSAFVLGMAVFVTATECPKGTLRNETVQIPHEIDCTKYYTCLGPTKVLRECPYMDSDQNRLYFNPELGICDWPWQAGCNLPLPIRSVEKTSLPTKCPKYDSVNETVLLPHERDCTKFYMCSHGKKVPKQCPEMDDEGLYFDFDEQICDWPWNVDCKLPEPRNKLPEARMRSGLTKKILPVPTYCPAHDSPDFTVHLAHEWDCTKFYKCLGGHPYEMQCPFIPGTNERLQFNKVEQVCDWPSNAGCDGRPTRPPPTRPPPTRPPPTRPPPTRPPPTRPPPTRPPPTRPPPTRPPPTRPPPGPNPGVEGCLETCPNNDPPNWITALPHEDCRKWCRCENHTVMVWTCPGDLHFSPTFRNCTNPEDAGCKSRYRHKSRGADDDDEALMNVLGYNERFQWGTFQQATQSDTVLHNVFQQERNNMDII